MRNKLQAILRIYNGRRDTTIVEETRQNAASVNRRSQGVVERYIRIGLIPKMVLAALLVLVMIITGLVVALQSTFDTNLSMYLKRVESEQITPIAELLGKEYERSGGWEFLHTSPQAWPMLVAQVLDHKVPASGRLGDMSIDVIGMLPRLTIHDVDDRVIMESPMPPRLESIRQQVTMPIMAEGKQVGVLLMVPTPIPVKGLDQQFRDDQIQAFYLTALPSLIITFLIAIPLGYHFLKPVRRLAKGVHQLAEGEFGVRLSEERNDELGKLAGDFNHLAKVLERAEAQRREGMASVSHELRTPLATMIAAVEAMQDGIRPLNAGQLQNLSGTMEHLNTLVDDLYQLALADVGKLVCKRESTDWGMVITEAVEAMRGKVEGRGLKLQWEPRQGVTIEGDPLRLRQVVSNLLENCNRYTEASGTVTVRLELEGERARLTVSDSGPGVESKHMAILFERFFRVDDSRSREHGGAGLGLALVNAIAVAHQGTATASIAKEGGLGISISLPLA